MSKLAILPHTSYNMNITRTTHEEVNDSVYVTISPYNVNLSFFTNFELP